MLGYFLGAGVMAVGGVIAAVLGVNAERTALEDVANPLSLVRKAGKSISGLRDAVADAGASGAAYSEGAAGG
jgi:hypothetical protein